MRRIRPHLTYANVISTLALFLVLAGGTTLAATGGNFILGQSNSASSTTSLSRSTDNAGKTLQVNNLASSAGATALGLSVDPGHAPFTVNSGTKVPNLNADKLDGLNSTAFLPRSRVRPIELSGPEQNPGQLRSMAVGDLLIRAECLSSAGRKSVEFAKTENPAATLNWFFSDGSGVEASGVFVGTAGFGKSVDFDGGRIEGQFIFSSHLGKITVNLHAFDAGNSCEVQGTALVAR